jgi:hypothetical protein
MLIDSEKIKTFGLNQIEVATAAATSTAKGLLAITTEATGYSKKSVENGFALWNGLLQARKPDEIVQLQSDFAKTAYDDFIAGAARARSRRTARRQAQRNGRQHRSWTQ